MSETISRRRHFAQVPDALVIDPRLSDRAVRLWVRLDKYAGKDGSSFPSRERLAKDIHCSVPSITRAFKELVEAGWVTRTRRSSMSNVWDTVLNDETTNPTGDVAGQDGRITGDPSGRITGDPSGESRVTRLEKETQQKETQLKDRSDGRGAPAGATRKRATATRRPAKLTDEQHDEQWALLRGLCREVGEDDPVAVWWTLRTEHGATRPGSFMADKIECGHWDGFVGRHGISAYNPDGSAA